MKLNLFSTPSTRMYLGKNVSISFVTSAHESNKCVDIITSGAMNAIVPSS